MSGKTYVTLVYVYFDNSSRNIENIMVNVTKPESFVT